MGTSQGVHTNRLSTVTRQLGAAGMKLQRHSICCSQAPAPRITCLGSAVHNSPRGSCRWGDGMEVTGSQSPPLHAIRPPAVHGTAHAHTTTPNHQLPTDPTPSSSPQPPQHRHMDFAWHAFHCQYGRLTPSVSPVTLPDIAYVPVAHPPCYHSGQVQQQTNPKTPPQGGGQQQ